MNFMEKKKKFQLSKNDNYLKELPAEIFTLTHLKKM